MLARALIVLFSVLNLGVVAWWIAHDPPRSPGAVQAPPGVARLQLVAERGASAVAPAPAPPAATNEAARMVASASTTPQCFSFGPFASAETVGAATAKLKPLVRTLTKREQPAASGRGWRVYLPPLPSLEQAQSVAERIGAAGFSDYLVVREGAEANSIALGRYSSEQAAKKHAEALNAAGFAAQAEALDASSVATWLDVVADAAFNPRRAQAAISAAQHRKADCPSMP